MLSEQGNQLNFLSKYYLVSKKVQSDPRFKAMEDRDREETFQEFIEKLGEQEREEKREQSIQRIEKLREDFKQDSRIGVETKWH